MPQKIAIIDYGVGNLYSVYKKLLQTKADVFVSHSPKEIAAADKIILPGVGHFKRGMENLRALSLTEILNEEVLIRKKTVLGICLGMQLMAACSEEAPGEQGLGWLYDKVVRFQVGNTLHFKVPHIGWNQLRIRKENVLMKGIAPSAEFYFTHSYHFSDIHSSMVLSETDYDYPFVSAVAQDHIFGVQFHPEKSHDWGIAIFENFLNI